jgi:hypothetical protein
MLAQAQADTQSAAPTWEQVRTWFSGTYSDHFPIIIVAVILLGLLGLTAYLVDSKNKVGVGPLQVMSLMLAGFLVTAAGIGQTEPQWGTIALWAVVACGATEIIKVLAERGNRRGAYTLTALLMVGLASYVFVNLANETIGDAAWAFTGIVIGPLASYGLAGRQSVVSMFRSQGATVYDIDNKKKRKAA